MRALDLGAVRGLVRNERLVGGEVATEVLVLLQQRRHRRLCARVVGERRSRMLSVAGICPVRHRDAGQAVGGVDPEVVGIRTVVVLGAAAVREHRDFGCGDERHDRRSGLGGPTTPTRLDVDANILSTIGTASAGSPLSSVGTHCSLCPRTPPDSLTTLTPARHPASCSGPSNAVAPLNGWKDVESKHSVGVAPLRGRPVGGTAGGCQQDGECGAGCGRPATS